MLDKTVLPSDASCLEPRFHPPCDLVINESPAAGSQASVTLAAGTNHTRRVVTAFSFCLADVDGFIATASTVGCYVIDGAAATTTYLWQEVMTVGTNGSMPMRIAMNGLNIAGSSDTALTIEFSAAVAGAIQSVNLSYHDIGSIGDAS